MLRRYECVYDDLFNIEVGDIVYLRPYDHDGPRVCIGIDHHIFNPSPEPLGDRLFFAKDRHNDDVWYDIWVREMTIESCVDALAHINRCSADEIELVFSAILTRSDLNR